MPKTWCVFGHASHQCPDTVLGLPGVWELHHFDGGCCASVWPPGWSLVWIEAFLPRGSVELGVESAPLPARLETRTTESLELAGLLV